MFNTLIAGSEYFLNRENLLLPIQMQLSKKNQRRFCCFLIGFLESTIKFELYSLSISEDIGFERRSLLYA